MSDDGASRVIDVLVDAIEHVRQGKHSPWYLTRVVTDMVTRYGEESRDVSVCLTELDRRRSSLGPDLPAILGCLDGALDQAIRSAADETALSVADRQLAVMELFVVPVTGTGLMTIAQTYMTSNGGLAIALNLVILIGMMPYFPIGYIALRTANRRIAASAAFIRSAQGLRTRLAERFRTEGAGDRDRPSIA